MADFNEKFENFETKAQQLEDADLENVCGGVDIDILSDPLEPCE